MCVVRARISSTLAQPEDHASEDASSCTGAASGGPDLGGAEIPPAVVARYQPAGGLVYASPNKNPRGIVRAFGYYEFFAGGGMARLGLGRRWTCLFANDNDPKKAAAYRNNFKDSEPHLAVQDVGEVETDDLIGRPTLAWASFPCQDLSLAGNYEGIRGARSGVFWPFWKLMLGLQREGRQPPLIVLENVVGLLTSNRGKDFKELIGRVTAAGYRAGALVIDAAYFLPQSRPRLFIVCAQGEIPQRLLSSHAGLPWHPRALSEAVHSWPAGLRESWAWWRLPASPAHGTSLDDVIEDEPSDVEWHTAAETARLLSMMTDVNREKVENVQMSGCRMVGAVYKRTRQGIQRAEVRFDGMSGCLRTPAGGSSRQTIIVVEGKRVRSRLISGRELARLMGVPDSYVLPKKYNEAYHLMGDGLAVPAVSWLEAHLLHPLARAVQEELAEAA